MNTMNFFCDLPCKAAASIFLAMGITCTAHAQGLVMPPTEALQEFAAVYSMIQTDYVKPVPGSKVVTSCLKGMFKNLDDQSAYLDKVDYDDLRSTPAPDSVGIGVELTMRAGLPVVISAKENSPAELGGLQPKDYILEIDGQSMEGVELEEALRRLRGAAGSNVVIVTRRPGEAQTRSMSLTRASVRASHASSRLLPSGVGYLKVRTITADTPPEIRAEFRKLQAAKPLRGLVLDLRNAPGGPLVPVIELAAMFLKPGSLVVATEGRLPESNQAVHAKRDELLKYKGAKTDPWPEEMTAVPMVVLVNAGTASGAEIIASALSDNGRAKLVGTKTFGRGIVQTIRRLSEDSAIKITTAYYRTPSGKRIHGEGLQPDMQAPDLARLQDAGTEKDEGLSKAVAALLQLPT